MITILAAVTLLTTPLDDAIINATYVSGRCSAWIAAPQREAMQTSADEGGPTLRAVYDRGVRDANHHAISGDDCDRMMLDANDRLRRLLQANRQPFGRDNGT